MNVTKAMARIAYLKHLEFHGRVNTAILIMADLTDECPRTIAEVADSFRIAADEAKQSIADFIPPVGWVESEIKRIGDLNRLKEREAERSRK